MGVGRTGEGDIVGEVGCLPRQGWIAEVFMSQGSCLTNTHLISLMHPSKSNQKQSFIKR
jgi:hypothetical protein